MEYISDVTNFVKLESGYKFAEATVENYMLKYGRAIEVQFALVVTENKLPNIIATITKNRPYRSIKIHGHISDTQWGAAKTLLYTYIGSDGLVHVAKPSDYTDNLANKHISINAVYLS